MLGTIRHRRQTNPQHHFCYKTAMFYLDVDELPTLFQPYWGYAYNRFNIAAFNDYHYLDGKASDLRTQINSRLAEKNITSPDKIFLLTTLAYLGYSFNPINLYFCYHNERLSYCLVEVTNTPWHEKQIYIVAVETISPHRHKMTFKKNLHVSPFLAMNYAYHLYYKHTENRHIIHLENWQGEQRHFDATLILQVHVINPKTMRAALLRYPLLSLQTTIKIYWQALRLYLKGVPFFKHPRKVHHD